MTGAPFTPACERNFRYLSEDARRGIPAAFPFLHHDALQMKSVSPLTEIIRCTACCLGILLISPGAALFSQPWQEHGALKVSKNNPHEIVHADGTRFLWFGDTGWEMIHRLNREEIDFYLEKRRQQGFNLIQTVILSEFFLLKPTNYYGDSLFTGYDPQKPAITPGSDPGNAKEYDFWDHVEYAVSRAEEKGLYLALVPSWGEWIVPREHKPLFNKSQEAYDYGWMIANRLKAYPNIIWVLGGDRHPDERKGAVDLWRAMAEGIADAVNGEKNKDGKADYSTTFMTHHSFNSSSNWFHEDAWIDCHMWGSYHDDVNNPRAWQLALKDWHLENPKPTINGEPCYEGHNINYALPDNGFFTSTDVRIAAYWSMFSGAAGFTYGAHSVWQFADSLRKQYTNIPICSWQEALNFPGASQLILLKKLLESYPQEPLVPDPSFLLFEQDVEHPYTPCLIASSYAFVYVPTGSPVVLKSGLIKGKKIRASWFDPRNGSRTLIGDFPNSGTFEFNVPGISKAVPWLKTGRGCDWVLVLEDAEN
ncbi:MAG: glycoside hydrolase family 140 protein [Bacteroidales bacterium]